MEKERPNLIAILGPTATGKTAFAACLADRIGGEVISADSRQVYRGMDIGTGKDYGDFIVEGRAVPYHLIDILEAGEEYNVYLFKRDFQKAFTEITSRKRIPVLCGGTGLYIESVLRQYRLWQVPANEALRTELEKQSSETLEEMLRSFGPLHNQTDTVNRQRLVRAIEIAMHRESVPELPGDEPGIHALVIGIRIERMERRRRITERLARRLKEGLVEEVEGLLKRGIPPERMEYYGLEYRYVNRYLAGEITFEEMVRDLNSAIHRFAKRQMTYFRGMEKRGVKIHWIDSLLPMEEKISQALTLLAP
jgi:tRNA dimethylallyltransferase